jgi:hypothetical protein
MNETVTPHLTSRPVILAAAAILVVLATPTWLWAHYSATIFLETFRVGFVACFG